MAILELAVSDLLVLAFAFLENSDVPIWKWRRGGVMTIRLWTGSCIGGL